MSQNNDDVTHQSEPEVVFDPIEARIMGCLMEKERTTPDSYPLTLNALVSACNQKTSRHPVMNLSPGEVGHCVHQLRDRELVRDSFTGRAERYEHRMRHHYRLDERQQAVLCTLMLRGPQTEGELRTNAARMASFSSMEQVHLTLTDLAERRKPLLLRLPRVPGQREERYMHLLSGAPDPSEFSEQAASVRRTAGSGKDDRIEHLEQEVARLRSELDQLWQLTGLNEKRDLDGAG